MTGPGGSDWSAVGKEVGLSSRELDVLALCAEGLSNREIAARLYLSLETVKSHLRNVYSRLGLRNRAQATAYFLAAKASGDVGYSTIDVAGTASLSEQLGLGAAAIDDRRSLLGLSSEARHRLTPLGERVDAESEAFTTRLYARLREHEEMAELLVDDRTVLRLQSEQRAYLRDLFMGTFGSDHVERLLRIGSTHHMIGLAPQWYLATYSHVLTDHMGIVFDASSDEREAIETAIVLIASAFFDASLVLDSYELAVADELAASVAYTDDASAEWESDPGEERRQASHDELRSSRRRSPLTRVHLTQDETASRRHFVGLDAAAIANLRALSGVVGDSIPGVLAEFYALLSSTPSMATLVSPEATERLMTQVASYWAELVGSDFDRAHAAARMRVGVVHERVGLSPQLYLAGLARQMSGLLRALPGAVPDVRRATDALIRAVIFDVTFVIDAYIEARADTLLHAGGYAEQLVTGLASGVVVVDSRGRIDHANQSLLDLIGAKAGVLRRMPIASALPFAGLSDLVQSARRAPHGRASLTTRWRGRTLRLTALTLRLTTQPGGSPLAIVVDDLSEVIRVGGLVQEDDRTFERVLDAVEAMAWEIDADDLTVGTISRSIARIAGRNDTDILGRAFDILLPAQDRASFRDACAATDQGPQLLRHNVTTHSGAVVAMRSVLVRSAGPDGSSLICGVSTVERDDVRSEVGLDRVP